MAASTAMIVYSADRRKRERVAKQGLRTFVREAATKLGLQDMSSYLLVLDEDGTEIEDPEYFNFVEVSTPLMLLTPAQRWKAPGRDETDSSSRVLDLTTDLSGVIHMSSEELGRFADSDFGGVCVRSDLQRFIVEASQRVRKDREVLKTAERLLGDDTTDAATKMEDLELGATTRSVRLSFSAGRLSFSAGEASKGSAGELSKGSAGEASKSDAGEASKGDAGEASESGAGEPSDAAETQEACLGGGGDEPVDYSALSSQDLREMRGNPSAEKELRSRVSVENALKSLKKLTLEKGKSKTRSSRVKGGAAGGSKDSPDGGSEDLTQLLHLLREDPARILGLSIEELELVSDAERYSAAEVVGQDLGDALRWASVVALASHHKLSSLLELYRVVDSRERELEAD